MGYSPRGYKSQTWLRQLSMHGPRMSLASKAPHGGNAFPPPHPDARLNTPATGFREE